MVSVSVVIPCYNYGHFLEDAVASVLTDQEALDVRVLVIDDASPDGSAEVARGVAARDSRVEVIAPTNKGHIATYNEGLLQWADGDYSVLMSADDRLTPGALPRAAALLDAHPQVGFAYGNVLWFDAGAPLPLARTRPRGWSVSPGQSWLERRFRRAQTGIISPEVVVRTTLQKRMICVYPTSETRRCGYAWRRTRTLAISAGSTRPTTGDTGRTCRLATRL